MGRSTLENTTLANTSGGNAPGRDEQTAKRDDARTATHGDTRNARNARNANVKHSGRPTGRREPNARRSVQNPGKSEP